MVLSLGIGIWIRISIITLMLFLVVMLFGFTVTEALGCRNRSVFQIYTWGFIALLAIGELVYLPCLLFRTDFRVYSITFGIVSVLMLISGLVICVRSGYIRLWISHNNDKDTVICSLLSFVIVVLMAYAIISRWCSTMGDDEYYMAKAGEILKTMNLTPTVTQAATGINEPGSVARADVSSLIVMYAFFARLFCVNHVAIARTTFSFLVILFGIAIIHLFGRDIFDSEKKTIVFVVLGLAFISFFKSIPTYEMEMSWTMRPWFGTPIIGFLCCFFALMIMRLYKNEDDITDFRVWLAFLILNLAMLQSEIVAVFLIPCLYVSYGLTYFVINRRQISGRVVDLALFSLIPELISALFVLTSYSSSSAYSGQEMGFDYTRVVYDYFLWGEHLVYVYFGLFFVSFIYLLVAGSPHVKKTFVYSSFMLGFTFANPLLFNLVSRYVTSQAVYFRIFYCVPVFLIITIAGAEVINRYGIPCKALVILITVAVIVLNTKHVIETDKITNPYKASAEGIDVLETLHSLDPEGDIQIVALGDIVREIRVYDPTIIYTCSRYSADTMIADTDYTYLSLYNAVCDGEQSTSQILKELGTEYLICPSSTELPDDLSAYSSTEVDGYLIVDLNS